MFEYTNPTASNLNFNLYRGGKRFKSRKYRLRKNRKTKNRIGGEGTSFFRPKTPEHVEYASRNCVSDCETNAKKLCKTTCDAATIAAIDVKNTGISRDFINELSARARKNEEKYLLLVKEHDTLKQKYEMLESVVRR